MIPNLKLPENLKRVAASGKLYPHSSNINFYVVDLHGEYPIPETNCAETREIFNEFEAEQIIEETLQLINDAGGTSPLDSDEILRSIFDKRIEEISPNHLHCENNHFCFGKDEDPQDIVRITFWYNEIPFEEQISDYMAILRESVHEAISTASGDDSFFDYMPGYVCIFAQLCEALNIPEYYNELINEFLQDEDAGYSEVLWLLPTNK